MPLMLPLLDRPLGLRRGAAVERARIAAEVRARWQRQPANSEASTFSPSHRTGHGPNLSSSAQNSIALALFIMDVAARII